MKQGIELIAEERKRQVDEEGWTEEHDDQHTCGELKIAAACYTTLSDHPAPSFWPWLIEWWKPSGDPIRNLVKAGALIAAEIDRLQREK